MAEEKEQRGKEKEKPAAAPESAQKPDGLGRGLFLGAIAGVVVINIIVALVLIRATAPKLPEDTPAGTEHGDSVKAQSHARTPEMGITNAEAPIVAIVNIAGTDGQRFIKIGVVLEYAGAAAKGEEFLKEMEHYHPLFKNLLIDQISQMTLQELNEPEARSRIRKEYLHRVNAAIPSKHGPLVKDVFLDDFLIQ